MSSSAYDRAEVTENMPLHARPPLVGSRVGKARDSASSSLLGWTCWAWTIHFLVTLVVLIAGVLINHRSRKYIPVKSQMSEMIGCQTLFLNVMAHSEADADAIICCDNMDSSRMTDVASILCPSQTDFLPLAARLTKVLGSWVLPLAPLLLRALYAILFGLSGAQCSVEVGTSGTLAYRRLALYIGIVLFRGCILYVALNKLEDIIAVPIDDSCWYKEWLKDGQSQCYGRVFDFSDHIVLYFGQILPISLVETTHSFGFPYWVSHSSSQLSLWVPVLLGGGITYLYMITLLGAFKTASFFHTGLEVFAGFAISLTVSIPLSILQCGMGWPGLHQFFFGEIESTVFKTPVK